MRIAVDLQTSPPPDLAEENALLRARLAEAEAQLASMAANPELGIWSWPDVSEGRIFLGETLREAFGLPGDGDLVSVEDAFGIVHPEDLTRVRAELEEAFARGGGLTLDYRMQPSGGGGVRHARVYAEVTTYPDRAPSMRGATLILDREQQLAAQRDRLAEALSRIVTHGGLQLWEWPSVTGGVLELNGLLTPSHAEEARANTLESSLAEDPWEAYLHPEDRATFRTAIARVLDVPGSFEVEARMRFDGGAYRWQLVRGSSTAGVAGADLQASGTLVDIEGRKAVEREAQEAAERLQLVVQGANAGVWDWPDVRDEGLIEVREDLRQLLGYEPHEVDHTLAWFLDLIHPDDHTGIDAALEKTFGTGANYEALFRIRFKDRGYRWVRSTGGVLLDAGGPGAHRLSGSIVDVHDRVVAERRVAEANVHLERFAQLVAHDLGAPLRHVAAFADILEEDFGEQLGEEGRHHLGAISRAIEQSTDMIGDLLEYARTGTSEIRMEPVDLGALCDELRDRLSAGGRAAHVTWDIGPLPTVRAGETQMRMLFQNLLSNAVKFTSGREGARVTVCEDGSTPEECSIVVRDNGVGFDPSQSDNIFEAFARAHSEREFEGTGIGLANVARVVARHGGRIEAEGEVGVGATFTVRLPR